MKDRTRSLYVVTFYGRKNGYQVSSAQRYKRTLSAVEDLCGMLMAKAEQEGWERVTMSVAFAGVTRRMP